MTDPTFQFGRSKINDAGYHCCGKPRGCTMTHEACAYLRHPWKRAMVFNDTSVRCQALGLDPNTNTEFQCSLNHGHAGACTGPSG